MIGKQGGVVVRVAMKAKDDGRVLGYIVMVVQSLSHV